MDTGNQVYQLKAYGRLKEKLCYDIDYDLSNIELWKLSLRTI